MALKPVLRLFDVLGYAGDWCPPVSNSRDENVNLAVGVVPDFGAGGGVVNGRVGGVVELLHDVPVLRLARISSALAIAPFMPLGPGVSTISAPKASSSTRAAPGSSSLDGEDQPVTLHGGDKSQRDAGVAAGRFNEHGLAGLDLARLLRGLNHRQPMRSFTLETGFWLSSLATTVAADRRHAIQPDQWGSANEFRYIRSYVRHDDLLFRM